VARIVRFPAMFALVGILTAASPASALVNRAFVSGSGADSGTCGTVAAPCKTLQFVHDSIVNPGGEIVIMGAGEYGPLIITKSLTVVNQGAGVASVTQPATDQNAIWVRAGAGDSVYLKGLTIEGVWAAASGVYFQSGAALQIFDCVIRRFKYNGVYATPPAWSKFTMTNVSMSDIAGSGVVVNPTGGFAGSFQGLKFTNLQNGFEISGRNSAAGSPVYSLVTDSTVAGVSNGFLSTSIAGAPIPTLALDNVRITGSGIGVISNRGNVRLSKSTIVGNGTGISISSGSVLSNKTSSVIDNGANVNGGTITAVTPD